MSKMSKPAIAVLFLLLAAAASAELPSNDGNTHMGVATCATSQCHGSAVPRDGSSVLQNEYVIWTQDDPHSRAFEVLGNDQSKAIAARLGLASATGAKICLDCHSDNVPASQRGDRFHLSDGVGCESCHGGAENWLASHYNVATATLETNRAAGMYPTHDVAARSELCLSCHLGTRDKFATHRIMAAGHPRLAFELDTFTELWRTAGRQPHYRVDADYRERKGDVSHAYTWAAGVVAESRQRMQLVAAPGFDSGKLFPELGLYDCHACHRSMKTVQWRALPRHGDVGPGQPFLHDGTLVMAMALAKVVAPSYADEIRAGLVNLHQSGGSSVADIQAAARALDNSLAKLQRELSPSRLRNRELPLLRELLATGAEGNFLDYITAEQAFMAVQMLVIAIGDPALESRLDAIADTLNDDERYRPARFAAMLGSLSDSDNPDEQSQ